MDLAAILVIAMFVVLIALLFLGYPVAFCLGGVGIGFTLISSLCIQAGADLDLDFRDMLLLDNRVYRIMANEILVALPMFIFMGLMLEKSNIAEAMMLNIQKALGRLRGGLALTVTFIGVLLAASTGIIGASVVLLGLLSLPVMLRQGYEKPLATGVICSAGSLGILIPPSIMLVIMADQLAISVGDLFLGAVFPGLILAAFYTLYIVFYSHIKPSAAPLAEDREALSWKLLWEISKTVTPPLLLIVLVLGSIFKGYATPTEASGLGAMGATLLALFNRQLSFNVFQEVAQDSLKTTAFIATILVGATCFSLALQKLGSDEMVHDIFAGLQVSPYAIIAIILFVVFLMGFVLDWIEITMIMLPIFGPLVGGLELGVNGFDTVEDPAVVWFAVLVAVALQTSFLTPPVGFALFYLKGVCPPEVKLSHIYKGVIPFVLLQIITLLIVLFWPSLVTWLPSIAYSK